MLAMVPEIYWRGCAVPINHYDRVTQLLDDYRLHVTGTLECRNDARLYDFIYRTRPTNTKESFLIMFIKKVLRTELNTAKRRVNPAFLLFME